ncbi:hypothetical protein BWR15_21275 [Pseudomonas sp. T]|nr:hypothetical protein BWR15_21275 [Pseudomonas sp. T]
MPRKPRLARDGPSRRAPETPKNRGYFSRSEKPDVGARLFGSFWEGGYPAFAKRDSPEGAKHEAHAHAEAAQKYPSRSSRPVTPKSRLAPSLPADRGHGPLLQGTLHLAQYSEGTTPSSRRNISLKLPG